MKRIQRVLTWGIALAPLLAQNIILVPPCRLADTRYPPTTTGNIQGPVPEQSQRDFQAAGNCGVPSNALGIVGNLTIVPSGVVNYVQLWASGAARPATSILNDSSGTIISNNFVVQLGTNGNVTFYTTNLTDVILDITGYLLPSTAPTACFLAIESDGTLVGNVSILNFVTDPTMINIFSLTGNTVTVQQHVLSLSLLGPSASSGVP